MTLLPYFLYEIVQLKELQMFLVFFTWRFLFDDLIIREILIV